MPAPPDSSSPGTRTFAQWMSERPPGSARSGAGQEGAGSARRRGGGLAATPGAEPVEVGPGLQLVPGVQRSPLPRPPHSANPQTRSSRPRAYDVTPPRGGHAATPSKADASRVHGERSFQSAAYDVTPPRSVPGSADPNGKWRSTALYHEVALKDLLADDCRTPCAKRLSKVLGHFDDVTRHFPNFKHVFDLIRSEFVLAMYASGVTTAGGIERVPYFEVFGQLRKENVELQSELDEARDESNKDALYLELQAKKSRSRYLAHQVDLLSQENEGLLEDVAKLTAENEAVTRNGRQTFCDLDLQNRRTKTQIRRLENENALMAHEAQRQRGNLADFIALKHAEEGHVVHMFHRRHEFAAHVQLMCHLEICANYILNEYDVSLHAVSQAEAAAAKARMVGRAKVIVTEIAALEQSCLALLQTDVGAMTNAPGGGGGGGGKGQRQLIVGHGAPKRQSMVAGGERPDGEEDGGGARRPSCAASEMGSGVADHEELLAALTSGDARDRDAFVQNMMGKLPSCSTAVLHATTADIKEMVARAAPQDALRRALHIPLEDTVPGRHDSHIDVLCGTGLPGAGAAPPELFKTVAGVDPTAIMELPPKTAVLQLKFAPPPPVRRQRQIETPGAEVGLKEAVQQALPQDILDETLRCVRGEHAVWDVYDAVYGAWAPRVPRVLDERLVEQLIFETYQYESFLVHNLYVASVNDNPGASREARDRAFFAKLHAHSLMEALEPVLERRYHLPLVVRKYIFELLATCEQLATRATTWFLKGLTPAEHEVATGRILSCIYRLLDVHWPVSPLTPDVALTQQELATVLQALYPSYASNRVDGLVSDLAIFTRAEFSLTQVRAFFASKVVSRTEAYVQDAERAIEYKATSLKWRELDRFDFADACCTALTMPDEISLDAVRLRLRYRHAEVCHRLQSATMRLGTDLLCLLAAETVWYATVDEPGGILKPKKAVLS